MDRKTRIANRRNYGDVRALSAIKYIVLHYTANDGDTDEANANYFATGVRYASAHIFVDDDSCTQTVPDNYVAWSVGGNKYPNTSGGSLYGKATNYNTYNIEMCDTVKDGKHNVSQKTLENVITIVKEKMKQFNVPVERVIRHYDVTGKLCPSYYVNEAEWAKFKAMLGGTQVSAPSGTTTSKPTTVDSSLKSGDVLHQAFASGKWWGYVTNYGSGSEGYSGVLGQPLRALRAYVKGDAKNVGYLEYRLHRQGGGWYDWQRDREKDKYGENFAGDCKNKFDGLQMRIVGVSGKHVKYRVHVIGKGWLDWVTDYGSGDNGYAGWWGYSIDAVQVQHI